MSRTRSTPLVYTVPAVAEMFGVDEATVRDMARAEGAFAGVPAIRVTPHQFRFSRVAIDRVLDGGLADPNQVEDEAA